MEHIMNEFKNDEILHEDYEVFAEKISRYSFPAHAVILITGATGLIGVNLVRSLLYANRTRHLGLRIIAWCRSEEKARKIYGDLCGRSDLHLIYSDITERPEALDEYQRIDYVIHAASITSSRVMIEKPVNVIQTAVIGTDNVLQLAREKMSQSVLYVSSMEMYGSFDNEQYVREEDLGYIDPLKVRSNYPESKRMCENLCIAYASQYGLPVKIARLSQTFGAGILEGENRVFAQFARSAIRNQDIVLHTKGLSEGNYCYLRDTLWALIVILMKGAQATAYNVSNEKSHTTIADMAEMVCREIADNRIKVIFDIPESNQYGYAADTRMKLNTDRLKALGWEPEIGLKESYQRLIRSMTFAGDIE